MVLPGSFIPDNVQFSTIQSPILIQDFYDPKFKEQ